MFEDVVRKFNLNQTLVQRTCIPKRSKSKGGQTENITAYPLSNGVPSCGDSSPPTHSLRPPPPPPSYTHTHPFPPSSFRHTGLRKAFRRFEKIKHTEGAIVLPDNFLRSPTLPAYTINPVEAMHSYSTCRSEVV